MLSGISTVCFTASYAVAWGLEWLRIKRYSALPRWGALFFLGAGLLAHTIHLGFRVQEAWGARSAVFIGWTHWYLWAAWGVAALGLILKLRRPESSIGVFVLPLSILLIWVGWLATDRTAFSVASPVRLGGLLHAGSLLLATVCVNLGLAAGLMYFLQSQRLKSKRKPYLGLHLPSLEWLGRAAESWLIVSVAFVFLGLMTGLALNLTSPSRGKATLPWSDPAIWSSALLFLWGTAVCLIQWFHPASRQGQKMVYLTVANFFFLAWVLATVVFSPTQHTRQVIERGVSLGASSGDVRPSSSHLGAP